MKNTNEAKAGYCRAPKDTQFKPGNTANTKRKPKKEETLADGLLRRIREPVRDPLGRKRRTTRLELAARAIVAKAAKGDRKALTDIIAFRDKSANLKPTYQRMTFNEAVDHRGYGPFKLTDEFYAQQAEKKKEFRRKLLESQRFGDVLEKVLRSRVKIERGGCMVRVSMQDIIVHNISNEVATGDTALINVLEKLNYRKVGFSSAAFTEVARPNAEQAAWLAEQFAEERRKQRELWNELRPDQPLGEDEEPDWSKA